MEVSEARVSVRSKDECDHLLSQARPEIVDSVAATIPRLTSSELFCADSTLDDQARLGHVLEIVVVLLSEGKE